MKKSIPFFAFLVLMLAAFGCQNHVSELKDHGITTSATISQKDVTQAVKPRDRRHFFHVSYFAEEAGAKDKPNVLADTTMSMADRIDKWQPGSSIGKFTTAQVYVNQSTFSKYGPGDKVEIVYLPEDPQVVKVKEEL